ncbi:putative aminopeptidase [Helianthus anomalus]
MLKPTPFFCGIAYSGGYNIKTGPGCSIELMKFDMGGSAAVLGAAKAVGQIKPSGVEWASWIGLGNGLRWVWVRIGIYMDHIKSNQLLNQYSPLDLVEIKSQPLKLTKIIVVMAVHGSFLAYFSCPCSPQITFN